MRRVTVAIALRERVELNLLVVLGHLRVLSSLTLETVWFFHPPGPPVE